MNQCTGNNTNDMNKELLGNSIQIALKVKFLANSEELSLYAGAIYSAIMWGRGKSQFQERKKYLK